MNICLFSSSIICADILWRNYNLTCIICDTAKFNQNIYDFAKIHDILFYPCSSRTEIQKVMNLKEFDLGISYGFGIIFHNPIIQNFKLGIMNIHAGDLPDFRGRHPISWAYLKNKWTIGVTFHMIDDDIDRGKLCHKFYVKRSIDDTLNDITKKIEHLLEEHLPVAVEQVKNKDLILLEEGNYYPPVQSILKEINPEKYDSKFIYNLFKSQYIYGGVRINGILYKTCNFFHPLGEYKEKMIITCSDGVKLVIF